MHRSTAILLLATAALAATTIGSWRAYVAERARADALQANIERQEPMTATAAPDPAIGIVSAVNETAAPDSTGKELLTTRGELFAEQRRLLQNETYRDAYRRHRRLEMVRGHIDLAKVMGISQEKADRLIEFLVDQEMQYMDRPQRNPRNEKELRIRQMEIQQAQQVQDAEIAALIGAGNLPKWKQYHGSLPARYEVYELGASLFADAQPLNERQIEPLIAVIHAERQRVGRELSEFTDSLVWSGGMEVKSHQYRNERQIELTNAANDRIHAAASSFLSAKQLEALDDRLRRETELQDAEFQARRAMIEAGRVSDGAN